MLRLIRYLFSCAMLLVFGGVLLAMLVEACLFFWAHAPDYPPLIVGILVFVWVAFSWFAHSKKVLD